MRGALVVLDGDLDIAVAVERVDVGTVASQNPADHEMADTHTNGTVDQEWATTGLVNEEECDGREDDEGSVLHTRGDQVGVTG